MHLRGDGVFWEGAGSKTMKEENKDKIEIDLVLSDPIIMEEGSKAKRERDLVLPVSILLSALIIAGAWIYTSSDSKIGQKSGLGQANLSETLFPNDGVELPARWGDLGQQLIKNGTIDPQKFEALYQNRGDLSEETKKLLYGNTGNLKITAENSGVILNLLWAFGLANKNTILEQGPMSDPRYGSAGGFASTGGWTIAQGDPMSHYSKHSLIILTEDQQKLVEKISQNIYRPCCDNSTYFPDCNHGMAMLGLLELMASQGASESEMYKAALVVNSYWFPGQYKDIAKFLNSKNIDWKKTSPEKLLGSGMSSASSYQQIAAQITPTAQSSGGGCGVDAGDSQQQPVGCAP
jgi:uncharacterized protein YoaH (UPF0181 family)